jgi:hypothetical protein
MTWSGLPDINDVRPITADDKAVMDEVRAVLEKHGALERFGLTLLHSHFRVDDDEVLAESVDPEARTLTIRPVPKERIPADAEAVVTSWRLDAPDGTPQPLQRCFRPKGGLFHMLDVEPDA